MKYLPTQRERQNQRKCYARLVAKHKREAKARLIAEAVKLAQEKVVVKEEAKAEPLEPPEPRQPSKINRGARAKARKWQRAIQFLAKSYTGFTLSPSEIALIASRF